LGNNLNNREVWTMVRLPLVELLAGVAEESCELGQAALKLRRVFTGVNPTPTTQDEAISHFEEELADLELYLDMINYSRQHVNEVKERKLERWEARMDARGRD
jgi:NTP pyrophosphatase (non-canonical NTP hydrolase)